MGAAGEAIEYANFDIRPLFLSIFVHSFVYANAREAPLVGTSGMSIIGHTKGH
tara:strand:- start:651 stop:809 length:159 start_codon:yes stop_codon:yes gene_type:complete